MSQPVLHHLRRVQAFLGHPSGAVNKTTSNPTDAATAEKIRRVLKVLLKDPWKDYSYVRHTGQTILTLRNASFFQLANIREVAPFEILQDPPILPCIKHPNIAAIEEIYSYNEKIFIVTEHLHVPFAQLQFDKYDLEEREIATILNETLRGLAYISSLRLSCRDLSQHNIWLSLDGDIKIVLDPRDLKYDSLQESPKVSQVLLDFPILAEMIEEMMLSRYHLTPDDDKWSWDAVDFLSCTLEGSIESLMNHCFLTQAVSPRRLIPRIRFAYETKRGSWNSNEEEEQAFDFDLGTTA
ncbi:uncharacterized protein RSE6_13541 [Rhynchosporium secalis]|uniref:Protein kinase domain-containing protein n=1 Tax=Rhynchosporium secalis TaxID=38038 RepID=A0A1E1MT46_RHYSE|nr:uncharacterized protein RSE6_13541 [Rhynchosporium secalis]